MEWRTVRIGQVQGEWVQQEELGLKVLRKEEGGCVLQCVFCYGKGKGSHGRGVCLVCSGRGETFVSGPIRKCVFCGGKGKGEGGDETTCLVCRGKGAVSVWDSYERCSSCKGRGRRPGEKLPCPACRGKGVLARRA